MFETKKVDEYGNICWYKPGTNILHREDGPAIEYIDGGEEHWYINGKRHREDGPAIEWGDEYKKWFLNGIEYDEKEWESMASKVSNENKTKRLKKSDEVDDYNLEYFDWSELAEELAYEPKCECGAASVGSPRHSDWCCLYEESE